MELNKHNVKILLFIIVVSIIAFVGLQNISLIISAIKLLLGLLSPLLIGLCIAFILNVLMKVIEERLFFILNKKNHPLWNKSRRPISLILTIGIIAGVIFVLMFQIVPEFKQTFILLKENIPFYIEKIQIFSENIRAYLKIPENSLTNFQIDWEKVGESITNFLQSSDRNFLTTTTRFTSSLFNGIFDLLIGFVFSIYMLLQKEHLSSQAKRILFAFLPKNVASETVSIALLSNKIFSRFVTGQCTEAFVLGVLCFIGMTILSMPYSFMISFLIGVTALIPIFGALVGTAIGAFLILMIDPIQALWFVVFIIVLQRIDAYFIYPRIVGNSVGLPSMWVLFAVIIGGSAFGLVGMLIGVPVFSIFYSLLQGGVAKRLKEKELTIQDIEANNLKDHFEHS